MSRGRALDSGDRCRWRPLSLVLLDIDHLKLINDTHGHEAGNRAPTEFAGRLLDVRRGAEVLARVGGEEFAWILPYTTGPDALCAAEVPATRSDRGQAI